MNDNQPTADAIREHHARLVSDLQSHVDLLAADVASGRDHSASARAVLAILEDQILPHAAAEEQVLYPLASRRDDLRVLVEAMIEEHRFLQSSIAMFPSITDASSTAAEAAIISTVFRLHVDKENDHVLPALTADPTVHLSEALSGMHDLLETAPPTDEAREQAGGVLDVRPLPPARRHQLIFSAFDSLAPGESFELVNDHDPKPLRYQLSAENPEQFSWDYLESGPATWRVRIARTAA